MILHDAANFFASARERESIRLERLAGEPAPWTDDPIFRTWRFCNVHREHDRTTEWFAREVRNPLSGLAVVEATVIFRWFKRIETGERIKDLLLDRWDSAEARRRLTGVNPLVTGAYQIKFYNGMTKLDGALRAIDLARPILARKLPRWGGTARPTTRSSCPPEPGSFGSISQPERNAADLDAYSRALRAPAAF